MSVFENFSALDELIQIIYQDINKFVVLSNVSDAEWTVHVGQSDEGRWWRGSWTEADVTKLVGSNASEILLETFAEKLSNSMVKGELYVKSPDTSDISLVLGPSSKKPLSVPLAEMDAEAAAIFMTRTLIEIGLNAQKRKCQLNPSAMELTAPTLATSSFQPTTSSSKPSSNVLSPERPKPVAARSSSLREETARMEKKRKDSSVETEKSAATSIKATKPSRALKGASLANPNKKARKYQALEFGSDDE